MNAQLTEIMRLITNLIRIGVVTEVDRENWLCRVKTGDLETNWINWLTLRAGNARTWWRPSEGEQVVLLSLGGNLETAFALPAIYSNQFAPPSTSADACVTEHPDGGWFEYEPATGRWYVRGIKSMVIEAADNITMKTSEFVLEADRTRINSEVVINGGTGGAPVSGISVNGKNGGSSSFGTYMSASGGYSGGQPSGGLGAVGVGGTINTSLGPGSPGSIASAASGAGNGGSGGGPGGAGSFRDTANGKAVSAVGPGGGGAGLCPNSSTGQSGAGADGAVYIYW